MNNQNEFPNEEELREEQIQRRANALYQTDTDHYKLKALIKIYCDLIGKPYSEVDKEIESLGKELAKLDVSFGS